MRSWGGSSKFRQNQWDFLDIMTAKLAFLHNFSLIAHKQKSYGVSRWPLLFQWASIYIARASDSMFYPLTFVHITNRFLWLWLFMNIWSLYVDNSYYSTRSTQPSIPPGSVNEYQLWLGRQRQVWLIPIADECVGVQVKLWNPLRTRAIPERFCGGDSLRSIKCMDLYLLPLQLLLGLGQY